MLIYKQRYKPRTTREFTKSDLTVYDSAGNTALNTLTVYGKSEAVDGVIKSAGEGWSTVDLGSLNWTRSTQYTYPFFYATLSVAKANGNGLTARFQKITNVSSSIFGRNAQDNQFCFTSNADTGQLLIRCDEYTDATAFDNAMSGVILAYEEATPTNNTIAVKTDNSTGINGTMAVFETGTPLRGIPDSNVRDVMAWNGTAGEVTKNCGEVDLGTLTWTYNTAQNFFQAGIQNMKSQTANIIIPNYNYVEKSWAALQNFEFGVSTTYVRLHNDNYTSASDIKQAMSGVYAIYEIATPTTEQLTTAENDSIAALRTFTPQTHAQNNAQTDMTVDYTIKVPTI